MREPLGPLATAAAGLGARWLERLPVAEALEEGAKVERWLGFQAGRK